MSNQKSKAAGQVRSLTRALTLLRKLALSGDGLTLTELSEQAGLPPSTTHRLLTTLEAERFVRTESHSSTWKIGVAAFAVGAAFSRSRDTMALVRPYLRRLMEMSGETANLYVESDGEAVCIGQIESRHAMRAIGGVGGRIMLHSSAAGKVLLAHMECSRRQRVVATMPLHRATSTTLTDRQSLDAVLEQAREQGYAVDNEEQALGLRCVAAPIFDEYGQAAAAISISGPSARIPLPRIGTLGRMVAQAASEATRDFGGQMPVAAQ